MLKILSEWAGRWLTRSLTLALLAATAKVVWDNLWEAALAALEEINGWLGTGLLYGTALLVAGTLLRGWRAAKNQEVRRG